MAMHEGDIEWDETAAWGVDGEDGQRGVAVDGDDERADDEDQWASVWGPEPARD